MNLIKDKDFEESQKLVAQSLNLPIQQFEKKRFQGDESMRIEITLSKEQLELVNRAKELMSHADPNPNMADLMANLAEFYIKKKDPLKNRMENEKLKSFKASSESELNKRIPINVALRRQIFSRDQVCQWRDSSHRLCGSKFQLEIDHKKPVWLGGQNEPENLQLLCRVHNRLKYEQELI